MATACRAWRSFKRWLFAPPPQRLCIQDGWLYQPDPGGLYLVTFLGSCVQQMLPQLYDLHVFFNDELPPPTPASTDNSLPGVRHPHK